MVYRWFVSSGCPIVQAIAGHHWHCLDEIGRFMRVRGTPWTIQLNYDLYETFMLYFTCVCMSGVVLSIWINCSNLLDSFEAKWLTIFILYKICFHNWRLTTWNLSAHLMLSLASCCQPTKAANGKISLQVSHNLVWLIGSWMVTIRIECTALIM